MRVLHLFDFYLPSTLSWVAALLAHLPGVQVEIAAPWIVTEGPFADPGIPCHLFPPQRWFFPNMKTEWEHPLAQRLFTRSQRFLPTYRAWLTQQLRQHPPDILHAHFGPTGCLYLPLAQKLDRPLIATFYGFDYEKLLRARPVFREKYRHLFAVAARVIAASPAGCQALEALGCPSEKLAIVRPAPDVTLFPFSARQKPPGTLHLIQVATFTEKKGHLTTLEAFRLALADCPNLQLTLAGEKWNKALVQEVSAFIARHHLEPHITWLDFLPHAQMAEFLSRFHVFIQPSQHAADGDHEASPVALLEAQATGLPVLATTHFDLADQVAHGISGLLSPERDAPALVEGIRRFYWMEQAEYQEFGRRAHDCTTVRFGVKASAQALSQVYTEVAAGANK